MPADTYIVTLPFEIPFTSPLEFTVATFVSDDLNITVESVAVEGKTVAVRFKVFPASNSSSWSDISISATGIFFSISATPSVFCEVSKASSSVELSIALSVILLPALSSAPVSSSISSVAYAGIIGYVMPIHNINNTAKICILLLNFITLSHIIFLF